jgi:ribosome biogenesis GTPase
MGKDKDRFLSYEEAFHRSDRKLSRMERKIASKQDRSKYKKTDQDQLKKGALRGRVLAIFAEGIQVDVEGTLYQCQVKGSLKKNKSDSKNLLAVGDFVYINPKEESCVIFKVEPRRSILSRADNLSQKRQQLIAANIDQVIITVSAVSPPLKPSLIDRYIIAARKGNMEPIIVINKADLLAENPEETEIFNLCQKTYKDLGITCIKVSVLTGEGIEDLKNLMHQKTSVFSGQSGTGKSSLINAITGANLKTGKLTTKTAKGSHTTTSTSLLPLEKGGFCVDTPGIRSFGIWNLSSDELEEYFEEIAEAATSCRFPGCSHLTEEGCAVLEAVEKGTISPLRVTSFFALLETIQKEHRSR